jgi:hypothetical protein
MFLARSTESFPMLQNGANHLDMYVSHSFRGGWRNSRPSWENPVFLELRSGSLEPRGYIVERLFFDFSFTGFAGHKPSGCRPF